MVKGRESPTSYIPIVLIGLRVGQDARPTGVVYSDTHCAPLERGEDLRNRDSIDISLRWSDETFGLLKMLPSSRHG